MSKSPALTVVMANYNGGAYLPASVQSVLDQSFEDFEFIVVDDCSNAEDVEYLQSITDARFRLIRNDRNIGQTRSLNKGLDKTQGRYVARMDSDDICLPDRFAKQVAALEEDPSIHILGGQAILIDAKGIGFGHTALPEEPDELWAYSILQSPFVHSSVMMRGSLFGPLGLRYNPAFINQDFELWSRILPVYQCRNLSVPVIQYRVHSESMTTRHHEENLRFTGDVVETRLRVEGLDGLLSRADIDLMQRYLFADRRLADAQGIDRVRLGQLLLSASLKIARLRPQTRRYLELMLMRLVQSALWPNRYQNILGRFFLLCRMIGVAPAAMSRVFARAVLTVGGKVAAGQATLSTVPKSLRGRPL